MLRISKFLVIVTFTNIIQAAIIRNSRLSLVDWNNYNYRDPYGPGSYAFGYDIEDPVNGNVQFRNEERYPNGTVIGSYGYVDPNGVVRIFNYIADHLGYRVKEEDGLKLSMLKPIQLKEDDIYPPDEIYDTPSTFNFNGIDTFKADPIRYFPKGEFLHYP